MKISPRHRVYRVNGIVLKEQAPIVLLDCIRAVAAGGTYFIDQSLSAAFDRIRQRDEERDSILQVLTPREIEVSRLAAAGLRSREIGAELGISRAPSSSIFTASTTNSTSPRAWNSPTSLVGCSLTLTSVSKPADLNF